MPIKFTCSRCDQVHEGMPGFGAVFPAYYVAIPEGERAARSLLTAETCIIDRQSFFVRGCIEIPVHGAEEPLIWGVWVSLSEKNFRRLQREPDCRGPFFGWLSTFISIYPSTLEFENAGAWPRTRGATA